MATTPAGFIRQALRSRDPQWIFHQVMTSADRDSFDRWLVALGDNLAFEAGTQESRFVAYCRHCPPGFEPTD